MDLFLCVLSQGGSKFDPLSLSAGGNALWTLVIFAVSIPLIWKVVMGPVTRALARRDETLVQSIAAAEKAGADAERARSQVEQRLVEAQAQASALLSQARERGEVREREIVEAAKKESVSLVEAARTAIRAEQDKAISSIRSEVVELSLAAASKVLERKVDADDDRRFVTELVSRREATRN